MKWSWIGRAALALLSAVALGLSMTACGGGTIAYLWVIGQQYNQVSGFKVDDYTGNLTAIPHSPFAANGANPVAVLLKPGGRYLYVINQGTSSNSTSNSNDANVAVFAVGGEGSLTFQQSYSTQGFDHMWAAFDSTGSYLFVLDKYSPDYATSGNGAITTFAADANTGRLTLVTQTASTPSGGTAPTYLDVGPSPNMMLGTASCLYTLNQGNQTVTPYVVSSGQLTVATTGAIPTNTTAATSITGNSTYVVVTDAGPTGQVNGTTGFTTSGKIVPYTPSASCGLTTFTGGAQTNDSSVVDPTYAFLDASNKYLYVLNQSSTSTGSTTPYSSITAYTIQNGELAEISGSPFKAGSGPVCMVEDPTSKFMYVSNQGGTITGYDFTATEGTLSDLARGSNFNLNDTGTRCLALSNSVD